MVLKKATFNDWDLDGLDAAFGICQIFESALLEEWENWQVEVTEAEKEYLLFLQSFLKISGNAWNEVESKNKFISPLIIHAKIDNLKYCYFLERNLYSIVGDYELSGIVDGMIATGFRSPHIPFFCLYKLHKNSVEEIVTPNAQVLSAMLVAQEMNNNQKPIYGLFIIGSSWQFIVLNGKEYCISRKYDATETNNGNGDVIGIFKMMKAIKGIIETKLL